MTVQTEFYNFQQNVDRLPLGNRPNPNASSQLSDYLQERFGGQYLGGYGERSVREGTNMSTHAFDHAFDWRYENPGPGLYVCDTEIIPFLISNSKELGIQAIHHYRRSIIWRPPGTSGRPLDSDGWKQQAPQKSGMGQSWALWLHIELLPSTFTDSRPVGEKLAPTEIVVPPPIPPVIVNPPITPPVLQPGAKSMINVEVETVRRGSTGPAVKRLQALLAANFGQSVTVDGNYGPQTSTGVLNVQRFFGLTADDVVGPQTWRIILSMP
jgi:hypothetical protein